MIGKGIFKPSASNEESVRGVSTPSVKEAGSSRHTTNAVGMYKGTYVDSVEEEDTPFRPISVGVCAMNTKVSWGLINRRGRGSDIQNMYCHGNGGQIVARIVLSRKH